MRPCHPFLTALALAFLVLTGCEQTTSTYILNPDGSGKLQYTATYPLDVDGPQQDQSKKQTDTEKVAEALNTMLKKSKGVEAWSDARCIATPDGLISFSGTAYFRDLTALSLSRLKGNGMNSMVEMTFTKIPGGYRVALLKHDSKGKGKGKDKSNDEAEAEADKTSPTKDTNANTVKRARTTWKYTRPLINAMLANDVRSYTFLSPKPATAVHGFQKANGGYSYTFDGSKMLKAMDDLLAKPDGDLLALSSKGDLMKDETIMNEALKSLGFDAATGLSLDLSVSAPQFDYAKEVAAVRKTSPAATPDTADTAASTTPAPAMGNGSITDTRLESISRSFPEPGKNQGSSNGSQVRVAVTFAAPVTDLGEASLTEITDENGKAITAKFAPVSANLDHEGRGATLSLNLPSNLVGVGRMAGTLTYSIGSGSKVVDLGVMAIKNGAKGSTLEATIEEVQNGWLGLKFKASKGLVKSIQVFTKEGQPFAVKEFQLSEWEGFCTKTLRPDEGDTWPQELAFKVELYSETKPFTAPWSVTSFSLPSLGK